MTISAMKQALEALEDAAELLSAEDYSTAFQKEAITALRQAIAEAEDEPRHVSYACPNCHWSLDKQVRTHTPEDIKKIESKWSGLTEDDLASCKSDEFVVFAKTIEAKLKEKNNG